MNIFSLYRFILALALVCIIILTLGACSQNPSNYQGISRVYIDYDEKGIAQVQAVDGKEFGVVTVEITNPDGSNITVYGKDVQAFDGQESRDRLRETLIKQGIKNPTKNLLDAVIAVFMTQ